MTELLQQAFEQAAKLPQTQQDTFARFLLAELDGAHTPSFPAWWRGQFQPAHRDDPRYDALARKYL